MIGKAEKNMSIILIIYCIMPIGFVLDHYYQFPQGLYEIYLGLYITIGVIILTLKRNQIPIIKKYLTPKTIYNIVGIGSCLFIVLSVIKHFVFLPNWFTTGFISSYYLCNVIAITIYISVKRNNKQL